MNVDEQIGAEATVSGANDIIAPTNSQEHETCIQRITEELRAEFHYLGAEFHTEAEKVVAWIRAKF